jgi:hypothetical protein
LVLRTLLMMRIRSWPITELLKLLNLPTPKELTWVMRIIGT